jgi:hypothetical protein
MQTRNVYATPSCTILPHSFCSVPLKELQLKEREESELLGSFDRHSTVDVQFHTASKGTVTLHNVEFLEVVHDPDVLHKPWILIFGISSKATELAKEHEDISLCNSGFWLHYNISERPQLTATNAQHS